MSMVGAVAGFMLRLGLVLYFAEQLVRGVVGTSISFGLSAFLLSVVFVSLLFLRPIGNVPLRVSAATGRGKRLPFLLPCGREASMVACGRVSAPVRFGVCVRVLHTLATLLADVRSSRPRPRRSQRFPSSTPQFRASYAV
jgi:hypothetical protein